MEATSACAVCGSFGFLLDKVPLFPLALGVALGILVGELTPALRQHVVDAANLATSSTAWRAPSATAPPATGPPAAATSAAPDASSPPTSGAGASRLASKTDDATQEGDAIETQKRSRRPAVAAALFSPGRGL